MLIKELFNIERGELQSLKNIAGEYDFITAGAEWKTNETYSHECEALIFAMGASGSLGRTHYVNGKFIASDLCFILTPKDEKMYPLDLKFYYDVFNFLRKDIVSNTATGTSKLAINITNFGNYDLPYFEIGKQIEYKKLLDFVGIRKNEVDKKIINQQYLLTKLRQAILKEAVQGKLVPQDTNDEPAIELLKRIKAEKEHLTAEKKIRREKPLPPITKDEIPYELPQGWVWCRMGEITEIIMGQSPPGSSYNELGDGIPLINGPVEFTEGNFGYAKKVKYTTSPTKLCKEGDIILCIRASIGKTNIAAFDGCIGRGVAALRPYFIKKYLHYFIIFIAEKIYDLGTGTTFRSVSKDPIRNILIPVPPLDEQKRIVVKVDELMSLCDKLEAQIQQSKQDADILMQAVLKEAFEA